VDNLSDKISKYKNTNFRDLPEDLSEIMNTAFPDKKSCKGLSECQFYLAYGLFLGWHTTSFGSQTFQTNYDQIIDSKNRLLERIKRLRIDGFFDKI
jgi:hypothetical protein